MDRDPPHRGPGLNAQAHAVLHDVLARERRRIVAWLARSLGMGHLALAEDALQTAALRALERWPVEGVPVRPSAWLAQVARREAIDGLRAQGRLQSLPDEADPESAASPVLVAPEGPAHRLTTELDDDELALVFAACHPDLPPTTQVALALRTLAGLDLATVAALLFTTEAALAQRLARARTAWAGRRLEVPAGPALAERRESVLTTLALMFHTGQQASGRQAAVRPLAAPQVVEAMAPCWEAIRLARAVATHRATAHGDAHALAALLLLHGARLTGRVDEAGDLVALPGQPRDRWDAGMVRMGLAHLDAARASTQLSRWHLQAGIAAEHAVAPDHAGTDWAAILGYYTMLLALDPSHAPRLGHAIALAEAGEPAQALTLLQAMQATMPSALAAHTHAAIARAHERLGELQAACVHLQQAMAVAPHAADARMLERRLQALRAQQAEAVIAARSRLS